MNALGIELLKKNKRWLLITAIISFYIFITLLLPLFNEKTTPSDLKESNKGLATGIITGSLAPDFELQGLEGKTVKLSDFKGKNIVLNFWATWCPFCVEEMPLLQKKIEENKNLAVIGVNLQEKKETAKKFAEKLGITYPLLLDPDKKAKRQFNVYTQPVTYFINQKGVIVSKKFGPLTETEINQKIKNIEN